MVFGHEVWAEAELSRWIQRYKFELVRLNPSTIAIWHGDFHPQAIALFLACCELGLWFYPQGARQDQCIEPAWGGVSVAVFRPGISSPVSRSANLIDRPYGPAEGGMILPSSGTSLGHAKLCRLPFSMLRANALVAVSLLGLDSHTPVVVAGGVGHTGGWNTLLLPALLAGAPVYLSATFRPHGILGHLQGLRKARFHFSPRQAQLMTRLKGWENQAALRGDHLVMIGSTDVWPRILRQYAAKGLTTLRNYGLTEVGPITLSEKIHPDEISNADLRSLGRLSSGLEMRIGETGEIFFRGSSVFDGYVGQPEWSSWFSTGDLVTQQGNEIYFRGRKEEEISVSGDRISPNLIEGAILERFAEVEDCVLLVTHRTAESLRFEFLARQDLGVEIRGYLGARWPGQRFTVARARRLRRTESGKLIRLQTS